MASKMWPKTDSSDYNYCCSDPIELRNLKQKLACLSCTCRTRRKKTEPSTEVFLLTQKDQQVQAQESQKTLFHQCTQANTQGITNAHDMFMNTITKDVLCPSCFVTMTILRGGFLKVVKDEEVETIPQTFSSENRPERNVMVINKSTSFSDKSRPGTTVTMCELPSEVFSEDDLNMCPREKQHQVKFMESKQDTQKLHPCLCLDKFMDSIRPPLADILF